jgi:hypothetical protein
LKGQMAILAFLAGIFILATLAVGMPTLFQKVTTAQTILSGDDFSMFVVTLTPMILLVAAMASILAGLKTA